ncbi:MAG: threonine synthase [Eubacteriales bacterium]|nr:threonine synthase [Eubacteriales bacterium]
MGFEGMLYHSTRNKENFCNSKKAILNGLCEDGGLYVSDRLPDIKLDIKALCDMSYNEIALTVFKELLPDYSEEELRACISSAYEGKFETIPMTPVTNIGGDYLLELYHGPTAAFKDVALCMLPKLMQVALKEDNRKVMIVTATSGDTGKAALAGFRDAEGISISVFYPDHKVSDIQYLQMATQEGNNVSVCAVNGNFDDCQQGVKEVFASSVYTELKEKGIYLSSANSINIGRLVPQMVYYIDAYKQLVLKKVIEIGDSVDFCVPTGNFGDILAGYYAKLMGLPVRKFIVASNENNVLTDFLTSGTYDRKRDFKKTISPSMDILVSSNLERLLYYASGMDDKYVASLMNRLKEDGEFTIYEDMLKEIRKSFDCGYATDEDCKKMIKKAYEDTGRLIDPHTAVAYKVLSDIKNRNDYEPLENNKKVPQIILSTASPYKFAKDVYSSIFGVLSNNGAEADGFAYMEELSERTGEIIPSGLKGLKNKTILHKDIIESGDMNSYVLESALELFK